MSTLWMDNYPSDIGRPRAEVSQEDPSMVLVMDGMPDYIRIPAEAPRYAGEQRRVTHLGHHRCPATGCQRDVHRFRVHGPGRLLLSCCSEHGFVLFSYRQP